MQLLRRPLFRQPDNEDLTGDQIPSHHGLGEFLPSLHGVGLGQQLQKRAVQRDILLALLAEGMNLQLHAGGGLRNLGGAGEYDGVLGIAFGGICFQLLWERAE